MTDVPHLVIHMGYGAFGVGTGTFNELPCVAIVPPVDGKVGEIGTDMIDGVMTEPLPGTVLIVFRDRAAMRRHIQMIEQLHDAWGPMEADWS